jgi:hypothetical protein
LKEGISRLMLLRNVQGPVVDIVVITVAAVAEETGEEGTTGKNTDIYKA